MKLFNKNITIILTIVSTIMFTSCEKQLEVDQNTLITFDEAVSTPAQLEAFLNSIYDVAANTAILLI